ncbi:MAG: UDP-N-acetylmuramoyl-L-alanine--D-glutamate ligase [Pseudomonadota bacterium]
MRISDILPKRVGLLGLGREGLATQQVLRAAGYQGELLVFGDSPPEKLPVGCRFVPTPEAADELTQLDVIIRSPGFPPSHRLRQLLDSYTCEQTTATAIFMHEMRDAAIPVIGITASKGKSTTSALTHACLQAAGQPSLLVGNIGQPAIELLELILQNKPTVVMELSSYQCADLQMGYGAPVASIGALFPEHLDYHGSWDAYINAKLNIARSQRAEDVLICHSGSFPTLQSLNLQQHVELVNHADGLHYESGWFYDGSQPLISDVGMQISGTHNRQNACMAFALARRFGVTTEHFAKALNTFVGLPFRLESEGIHHGIHWVNDSISTAPEATAAALEALGKSVHTLIAGGQDRGLDPEVMVAAINNSGVREVVLLPDTGRRIASFLEASEQQPGIHLVLTMEEAVQLAVSLTPPGLTCLMSPGAPSYNSFSGFEARGREFRRCLATSPANANASGYSFER